MFLFNLVLLNEINKTYNETKLENYKVGDKCEINETNLEEGFICCNFSVCDKYCYKDKCVPSNKIWFCTQSGIFWCFAIKHFLSFLFMIFSIIIRIYYKTTNQIVPLIFFYIGVLFSDLLLWCFINGGFCSKFEIWRMILLEGMFVIIFIFFYPFPLSLRDLATNFNNFSLYGLLPDYSYSRPTFHKLGDTINSFVIIVTELINCIIIIDFLMYLMSNNHRKRWEKYIEILEKKKSVS